MYGIKGRRRKTTEIESEREREKRIGCHGDDG